MEKAVSTSVLSLTISTWTGVVDLERSWKVTPGMAVLTVLELLLTEMPSTVSRASCAVRPVLMLRVLAGVVTSVRPA